MRILLVHNYYGSAAPSGENQVFELEKALLEKRGHEVRTYVRCSDEIRGSGILGLLRGAVATPWSFRAVRDVGACLSAFRPEIVHAHNTFPLISSGIFAAARGRAARVLTLHNYRLFCPAAIPLREGKPCVECLTRRSVVPALRHGCYRGSRLATLPISVGVALHRVLGTWTRDVEAFVALSEFQRSLMADSGLPAERVHVKPNFYPGRPVPRPWSERRECVVFAGRLSEEKGVENLVDAWVMWGEGAPELRVVGDGPLRQLLELRARYRGRARITFLGQLPSAAAEAEIAAAKLLVLPSVCFEGFPMVVREAFAFGTPVAVSNVGPLPAIVENGRTGAVFGAGDSESLLRCVRDLWYAPSALSRMSSLGRKEFEMKYAEEANYEALLRIYANAIQRQREHAYV